MEGEEAMEIFKIIKAKGMLPQKMEDLVPISFIGQTAVTFYRQMIKGFDKLHMTEEQRKRTLKDGQEAGEMLLDIEVRIGELAQKEEIAKPTYRPGLRGSARSELLPKHERLGLSERRVKQSQAIARNPEIVERVKAQAREAEDIPTRTAVVNEIRYQKEKERRIEAESKREDSRGVVLIEQAEYLSALDRCITILPTKPPAKWGDATFKEAKAKAQIIVKRLEVFIK